MQHLGITSTYGIPTHYLQLPGMEGCPPHSLVLIFGCPRCSFSRSQRSTGHGHHSSGEYRWKTGSVYAIPSMPACRVHELWKYSCLQEAQFPRIPRQRAPVQLFHKTGGAGPPGPLRTQTLFSKSEKAKPLPLDLQDRALSKGG